MRAFLIMTKTNVKLLLRNVGFLVCLILLPIGASLLHMIQTGDTYNGGADAEITEIRHIENFSVQDPSHTCVVVIDAAGDEFSELLLQSLARSDWYAIARYQSEELEQAELEAMAQHCYEGSSLTAVMYIPKDFGAQIMGGGTPEIIMLDGRGDQRLFMLNSQININLSTIMQCVSASDNPTQALDMAQSTFDGQPTVKSVTVDGDSAVLTSVQVDHLRDIGYATALLSLAFVLTGCFVANLVVTESGNKALLRIEMSGVSMMKYVASKALTAVLVTLLQVGVVAAATVVFVGADVGIPFGAYLLFIGTMGLIYNLLCLTISIFTKNIMFTIYTGFGVWIFSNLLSAVYFDFVTLPDWWEKAAFLMPQKWVMICSEMVMKNESGAYRLFLTASAAFLIFILTAGFVGTKISDNSGRE